MRCGLGRRWRRGSLPLSLRRLWACSTFLTPCSAILRRRRKLMPAVSSSSMLGTLIASSRWPRLRSMRQSPAATPGLRRSLMRLLDAGLWIPRAMRLLRTMDASVPLFPPVPTRRRLALLGLYAALILIRPLFWALYTLAGALM